MQQLFLNRKTYYFLLILVVTIVYSPNIIFYEYLFNDDYAEILTVPPKEHIIAGTFRPIRYYLLYLMHTTLTIDVTLGILLLRIIALILTIVSAILLYCIINVLKRNDFLNFCVVVFLYMTPTFLISFSWLNLMPHSIAYILIMLAFIIGFIIPLKQNYNIYKTIMYSAISLILILISNFIYQIPFALIGSLAVYYIIFNVESISKDKFKYFVILFLQVFLANVLTLFCIKFLLALYGYEVGNRVASFSFYTIFDHHYAYIHLFFLFWGWMSKEAMEIFGAFSILLFFFVFIYKIIIKKNIQKALLILLFISISFSIFLIAGDGAVRTKAPFTITAVFMYAYCLQLILYKIPYNIKIFVAVILLIISLVIALNSIYYGHIYTQIKEIEYIKDRLNSVDISEYKNITIKQSCSPYSECQEKICVYKPCLGHFEYSVKISGDSPRNYKGVLKLALFQLGYNTEKWSLTRLEDNTTVDNSTFIVDMTILRDEYLKFKK